MQWPHAGHGWPAKLRAFLGEQSWRLGKTAFLPSRCLTGQDAPCGSLRVRVTRGPRPAATHEDVRQEPGGRGQTPPVLFFAALPGPARLEA